ncbi:extensin-like, partial [Capsicum annuum]
MSHGKKHLKDAVVEVTCKAGDKKIVSYGTTKINGKFSITVEGFEYRKYGAKACKAKLHNTPKDSKCSIPTNLHWGTKECKKPKATPAPYYYKSPPPPTPNYVYKSPPPPSPAYVYKSPPPPSPTYVYKSPPPPSPTYVYKSPSPPSP